MDCWKKGINVQQEMKCIDLLNCCLLHPQVQNQQVVLFALNVRVELKVDRHPGLQNARQMIIFENALIVVWFFHLFE